MLDYLDKLIAVYLTTAIGLLLIKLLGWFGAGSLAWSAVFLLSLGPGVFSVLIFLIVVVAGFLTLISAGAAKS